MSPCINCHKKYDCRLASTALTFCLLLPTDGGDLDNVRDPDLQPIKPLGEKLPFIYLPQTIKQLN